MKVCIYGSQGHMNTILDFLENSDKVRVVGICCEPEEDNTFIRKHLKKPDHDYSKYLDFKNMIKGEKPDIVVISSLPQKNTEAICFAAQRNIHIFCEKPVALTMKGLWDVKIALDESASEIYSMMTERFDPVFYTAYRAALDERVGKVRLIDTRKSYKLGTRPDYFKSKETFAGTLSWVGIHAIDRIFRMSGEKFERVFAQSSNKFNNDHGDLDTTAICSCEMAGDVLASFTCDYYRPESAPTHGDDRVRIVGTDGIIEVMNGKVLLQNKDGTETLPLLKTPQIFEEFLNYIETGDSDFLIGEDCLYTTYAALKIMESSQKSVPVELLGLHTEIEVGYD